MRQKAHRPAAEGARSHSHQTMGKPRWMLTRRPRIHASRGLIGGGDSLPDKLESGMSAGPRQLLETCFTRLSQELETLLADAREQARREAAEQFNQFTRRLRAASGIDELCAVLSESASSFASGALL